MEATNSKGVAKSLKTSMQPGKICLNFGLVSGALDFKKLGTEIFIFEEDFYIYRIGDELFKYVF